MTYYFRGVIEGGLPPLFGRIEGAAILLVVLLGPPTFKKLLTPLQVIYKFHIAITRIFPHWPNGLYLKDHSSITSSKRWVGGVKNGKNMMT